MNITISLSNEVLGELDRKRGLAGRSAYIGALIVGGPVANGGSIRPDEVAEHMPAKIAAVLMPYQKAETFCETAKKVMTMQLRPDEISGLIQQAKDIADELGINVNISRKAFFTKDSKFICSWE